MLLKNQFGSKGEVDWNTQRLGGRKTCWAAPVFSKGRRWASEESRDGRGGKEKLTEFSDWLQISNPEGTLDGDTNNQDRMEGVEEVCGGGKWIVLQTYCIRSTFSGEDSG